jgi:hypothetical protein
MVPHIDFSPGTYLNLILDLEQRYGGQYRAFTFLKKRLLDGTELNIDNLKSVNEVRNRVLAFINHCYAQDHTSYLDTDAFMEDINNKLMTEKLLTKLWTDHKVWNLKEPLSSINVIAEWLNLVKGGLNYARMKTTKVEVNTSSGTVQKPNIATAITESTSSKVNVSTAQNTRNALAAITEVPEEQLLKF